MLILEICNLKTFQFDNIHNIILSSLFQIVTEAMSAASRRSNGADTFLFYSKWPLSQQPLTAYMNSNGYLVLIF